jgi:diaminohydroxyphosphoribosylaminopyrimidine deaminase/5-amino-6-(5-phosphoribosylamino)uracil reductase
MLTDEFWMQRALDLALLGGGFVVPNPWVGCVIVRDGNILGEGYHAQYGGPHAEVQAFSNAIDAQGSTVYVSLEPCSHIGKTPPCADLLIKHQVKRVVICNLDPNPLVAGQGVAKLQAAGIEVTLHVLAKQGEITNRRFFDFHRNNKPFVTIKYASSADQFIAHATGKAQQFSNPISHQLVHRLRAEHQAILIGVNTANADNPSLTTRDWPGQSPLRMVLDPHARMNQNTHLLQDEKPTLIFTYQVEKSIGEKKWVALGEINFLGQLMAYCQHHRIQSILVEGGTKTIESFIEAVDVQEIIHIESSQMLESGIPAPKIEMGTSGYHNLGKNNRWQVRLGKENLS